jgi:protein-S-isoprenylcysteine O-methyltransferase Ste14
METAELARWAPLLGLAMLVASTGGRLWGLRRIGIDALCLGRDDSAHAFLGRALKAGAALAGFGVVARAMWPGLDAWAGSLGTPPSWLVGLGVVAMIGGAALVGAGQVGMGRSWRIGIDPDAVAGLVTHGLFGWSRNPIYCGLMSYAVGLFAVVPNGPTMALCVAAFIGVNVQVRLEEEHMARLHGAAYDAYRARVRRWL